MELPPYRMPSLKSIFIHMWERTWQYLKKAGTIILAISMIMWFLFTFPLTPENEPSSLEDSYAGRIGVFISPIFKPLGFDLSLIHIFAAKFSKKISDLVLKNNNMPPKMLLNINIPDLSEDKIKGVKITRQSDAKFKDFFLKRTDPRGRDYYWMDGEFVEITHCNDSDYCALKEGYVSITPIHYDMTDYSKLSFLEKWEIKLDE